MIEIGHFTVYYTSLIGSIATIIALSCAVAIALVINNRKGKHRRFILVWLILWLVFFTFEPYSTVAALRTGEEAEVATMLRAIGHAGFMAFVFREVGRWKPSPSS